MAGFEFCTGHLQGRISGLEYIQKNLKGLHEVLYLQARKIIDENEQDEDAITLIGMIRLVGDVHKEVDEVIQELREMADAGLALEGSNARRPKPQGRRAKPWRQRNTCRG